MILPTTALASLILLTLTLLCWGSWSNSQKVLLKVRFELFYYDFALGLTACVLLCAFTLGSLNSQELTVSDNMLIAGYHKLAFAVGAGVLANLAFLLLVAATSLSGMAVSFPLSFGIGLVVMSITNFAGSPQLNNGALLFSGIFFLLVAIVTNVIAYRSHLATLKEATKYGPVMDPRTDRLVRPPIAARGILLGVFSGLLMGFFFPLIESSRGGDNGVGPYGLAALIGLGMFFSTLLYVPFFMNFPVNGKPLQAEDYFKSTRKQHLWGVLGGFVWAMGLVAVLVAAAAPPAAQPSPAISFGLVHGAPLVAALWGLLTWHEAKDSSQGVKLLLVGTLVLYLAGVTLISLSSIYATK